MITLSGRDVFRHKYHAHFVIEGRPFDTAKALHTAMASERPDQVPPLPTLKYRLHHGPLTWEALYAPVHSGRAASSKKGWTRRKQAMANVIHELDNRKAAMKSDDDTTHWGEHPPLASPLKQAKKLMTQKQTTQPEGLTLRGTPRIRKGYKRKPSSYPVRKLKAEDYARIVRGLRKNEDIRHMAKEMTVSESTITNYANKIGWVRKDHHFVDTGFKAEHAHKFDADGFLITVENHPELFGVKGAVQVVEKIVEKIVPADGFNTVDMVFGLIDQNLVDHKAILLSATQSADTFDADLILRVRKTGREINLTEQAKNR